MKINKYVRDKKVYDISLNLLIISLGLVFVITNINIWVFCLGILNLIVGGFNIGVIICDINHTKQEEDLE